MCGIEGETTFLVPLDGVDRHLLEQLGRDLESVLPVRTAMTDPVTMPKRTYNTHRDQYNSTAILSHLRKKFVGYDKLLAITNEDLFAGGLNFVFGEADVRHAIAVISLARLRQEFYGRPENQDLFYERVLKEAVHELGHVYGLGHCPDSRCVMHFSNSLRDTDRKSLQFCGRCRSILAWE